MALKHRVDTRSFSSQSGASSLQAKKKRIDFLLSFSKKEWALNGHNKQDVNSIFGIYESLLLLAKRGKCLDMGCGTGILCGYIHSFSSKEVVPFGIDKDYSKIRIAQKNNKGLERNFIADDYFDISGSFLKKFSTIIIFVEAYEEQWLGLLRFFMDKFQYIDKKCTVIVFCYEIGRLLDCYPEESPRFFIFRESCYKKLLLSKNYLENANQKIFVRYLIQYFFTKNLT